MFAERTCMPAQSLSHGWFCDPTDCIACQAPLWNFPGRSTGVGCYFHLYGCAHWDDAANVFWKNRWTPKGLFYLLPVVLIRSLLCPMGLIPPTAGVLWAVSPSGFSLVGRAALNKATPPPWDSCIQRLLQQGVGSPGPLIQMGQHWEANLQNVGWDVHWNCITGTSLVVHWLRIHLAMPGTWVQSLVWELGSHMLQDN